MLSDHALTFFETDIERKLDLKTMQSDQLLTIFRKRYKTTEQQLIIMDEWNSVSFDKVTQILPIGSLKERTETLGKIRLYLKNDIFEFQHKCKPIETN